MSGVMDEAPVHRHVRTDKNVRSVGGQMEEYRRIADRIAREQSGPVLDWGCGLGQVSDLLLERGVDVTSFDYQEGSEGWHRLALFPHVNAYLTSDPVRLPFDDASFDAVLSCGVLEHVTAPADSLRELHRVLRPGGTLYVFKLPNRFSWIELAARRTGRYHHGVVPTDRLYDKLSARQLIAGSGYEILELRRANVLPITSLGQRLPAQAIWPLNDTLVRVPALNVLATNIEVVARAV